jgi:hypothetical protein
MVPGRVAVIALYVPACVDAIAVSTFSLPGKASTEIDQRGNIGNVCAILWHGAMTRTLATATRLKG